MSTPADVLEPRELGTLIVVVGKARNLPNKSRFGKQDPFCAVKLQTEKQRTKAIKRGGQHPEWDEELRFTVKEDLEDALARSDSQADTSLSASTSKDGSLSGVTTAAALANKSRKGPVKKAGRKLNVACYADDAKEPDLIGECAVDIDEVLRKGEVDEWYEFTYKDKYSGEVYLELTFFSNEAPPVKRNPHIQRYGQASVTTAGSSASLSSASRPSMASLSTSSSVSGMNLYIPPYAQPPREPSPAPSSVSTAYGVPPSGSFAQLGLPSSHSHHRNQSLPSLNGQPGYPPPSLSSMASISTLQPIPSDQAVDALTRPMSSMSISSSLSHRPLPPTTSGPPPHLQHHQSDPQNPAGHRHSMGEAPWSSLIPPQGPPSSSSRPLSTSSTTSMNQYQWDQIRQDAATPLARPPSSTYPPPNLYNSGSYSAIDQRAPSPIPPNLTAGPPPGHRHAQSFSGLSGQPHPSTYLHNLAPAPTPPPASHSAPPVNQYPVPSSSYSNLAQAMDAYRAETPMNPYRANTPQPDTYGGPQTPRPQEYSQGYNAPLPAQYDPQPQQAYDVTGYPSQPSNPMRPSSCAHWSGPVPPRRQSTPSAYGQQPPPPPQLNSSGYVPWDQQTQPAQPSGYQSQSPYQHTPTPPPVPDYNRPAPNPPIPSRSSVGYYPSDELYAVQDQSQPSGQAPWQQQQQYTNEPQRQGSPMPPSSSAPPDMYQQQAHYQQQQQQHQQSGGYPARIPSPAGPPSGWQSTVPQASYAPTPPPSQPYSKQYPPQPPPRSPSPAPPHPPNGWQSQQHQQQAAPPPPGRAPSPAPLPAPGIKHDWRSYMQSLNAAGGRTPSPAPPTQQQQQQQPMPGQQDWYTPPPSLPSSIRPPDGWNSGMHVSQDGHQWRG